MEVTTVEFRAGIKSEPMSEQFISDGARLVLNKIGAASKLVGKQPGLKELKNLLKKGRIEEAGEMAQRLIGLGIIAALNTKEQPILRAVLLLTMGDGQLHSGDYAGAEKIYREAYQASPESGEKSLQAICLNTVGAAIGMQDRYQETIEQIDKALDLSPKDAQAWYNKGLALSKLGRADEAISCYEQALKIDKSYAQAWCNKGVVLSKLGRPGEAIGCYDQALKREKDSAQLWCNKGLTLGATGKYKEEIECYDKALKISKDFVKAWCNKGVALGGLGKYKDELACYDRALKIKEDYAEAWCCKGLALGRQGNYEEEIECYDKALDIDKDFVEAWYNKGFSLGKHANYEEAVACFESAFPLREHLADKGAKLYSAWADLMLSKGIAYLTYNDIKGTEKIIGEFKHLREEARGDELGRIFDDVMNGHKARLFGEELRTFTEFEDMLALFSISDPLERWRRLRDMVNERWSSGLSVLAALTGEAGR